MKRVILVALLAIFLDQIAKFWVKNNVSYDRNYGAAFGLFQGWNFLFILTAILVSLIILYYSKKYDSYFLGFLLGGTVSNLIDRLVYGYIIDFIKIWIIPSFNFADVFNIVGVIGILYYLKSM